MSIFTNLTTTLTNPTLDKFSKFEHICKVTTQLIPSADRVSLWRFSQQFDAIECLMLYEKSKKAFSSGQRLEKSQFEPYFLAILKSELIVASDARYHPQTSCFTEGYFTPLDIHSLLDVILHEDFEPAGVVCCESVGKVVEWSEDDIANLKRIARASSMYLK